MVIRKEITSIGDGVGGGNPNLESRSKNGIRPGELCRPIGFAAKIEIGIREVSQTLVYFCFTIYFNQGFIYGESGMNLG